VRGVGEAGKLSLPCPLLRLRGPSRLTTDTAGLKARGHPCAPVYHCAPSAVLSLPSSLCLEKRKSDGKKERAKKKRNRKKYQDLEGAALPSSLGHSGAGLYPFHRYIEPPIKTCEAWVYDSGGARGLSSAGGPYIPRAYGRIHDVLYGVL
jgi:hypothetical protein